MEPISNLIRSNISDVSRTLVLENIDWKKNLSVKVAIKPVTEIVYLYNIKKINS